MAYAENDLVFWIVLDAVAAKTLIHLRIDAPQWLQNGNWRGKARLRFAGFATKAVHAPQAQDIKTHAAKREHRRNDS